ncbi:MAG: HAMP domain-containing histidine kinase [Lachnospiraceae bacterium]|nr:HAMP domain-containing histidine kinase [Lachnospiraceae bacterium]
MKHTLHLKFILGYIIFGLFSFLAVSLFVPKITKDYLIGQKAQNLYSEASLIADTYAEGLYSSRTTLETVTLQLDSLSVYMDADIRIISPEGIVILDTAASDQNADSAAAIIPDFDPSVGGGSYYLIGDFFGSFDEQVISVICPIISDYRTKGYVTIHVSMDDIEAQCISLLNISYVTLIIMFLLSLIILIFFTRLVYLPLRKITKGAEKYAEGNYHYEVNVESRDEMGYLAAALNYMAGKIADAEDDQKKFIANVSHDFRSPLTSIKGYLEAMLDGTIPPEMHEKYLGIVLNETERLTKLTNGLLSLNNLNTKGMHLDLTDFDINDMVRKVAETFEGTCRKKSIAIELVLMGDELLVHADKGRIEQIVYNLTDNAVKFSNHDSVIKIETAEKKNKIYVSVKDNGIGIPPEDVGMIFNRFYKSDASRGKDKKGTGLGLSIVKEILAAHNENINVISTPGEGSEFIFSLQPADPDEI